MAGGRSRRAGGGGETPDTPEWAQELRFCRAPDGVRIAWARHGSGPPLVVSSCWLSHLQQDWQSPVWRHFLDFVGRIATVIRYDERGHGLSDRDVDDHDLEKRVGDLEAVVEAAGLDRFALMAMAQGGPAAITFAARYRARITRMLFYNTFAAGHRELTPEVMEMDEALEQLIRVGWDSEHSEFRRVFSSLMIPGGGVEQLRWLDDLLRVAASRDVAIAARRHWNTSSAVDLLPELRCPALVLHCRGDRQVSFEDGRLIASSVAGARLVALESENHIVLEDEPAWMTFTKEVAEFMVPDRRTWERGRSSPPLDAAAVLSERELEVLRLAAEGQGNMDIARQLVVSVRTVERHLQNVYVKLGVSGKTARAAAVAKLLASQP